MEKESLCTALRALVFGRDHINDYGLGYWYSSVARVALCTGTGLTYYVIPCTRPAYSSQWHRHMWVPYGLRGVSHPSLTAGKLQAASCGDRRLSTLDRRPSGLCMYPVPFTKTLLPTRVLSAAPKYSTKSALHLVYYCTRGCTQVHRMPKLSFFGYPSPSRPAGPQILHNNTPPLPLTRSTAHRAQDTGAASVRSRRYAGTQYVPVRGYCRGYTPDWQDEPTRGNCVQQFSTLVQ
jgi:hypothetical protein